MGTKRSYSSGGLQSPPRILPPPSNNTNLCQNKQRSLKLLVEKKLRKTDLGSQRRVLLPKRCRKLMAWRSSLCRSLWKAHRCIPFSTTTSRKALEKANDTESLREALGEPIVRGQWFNATLAVRNKKTSAASTFPIVGPHGNGILQVKAVSSGANCNQKRGKSASSIFF